MKRRKLWSIIGSTAAISMIAGLSPIISSCSCSCSSDEKKPAGAYWINIKQTEGGKVSVEGGKKWAMPGDRLKFSIVAKVGYVNAILYLDNESIYVNDVQEYTYGMPDHDLNVSAKFLNTKRVGLALYPGIPVDEAKTPNYIINPETGEHVQNTYLPMSVPRGMSIEDAKLPTPVCGVAGYIFDCWCLWDPEGGEAETGEELPFSKILDAEYYILVAKYKSTATGDAFYITNQTADEDSGQQRFYYNIHFRGYKGLHSVTLRTKDLDENNYISCHDPVYQYGTGYQQPDFGLFQDKSYKVELFDDESTGGVGNLVEFSAWWVIRRGCTLDATFKMDFSFIDPDGLPYSQTIENVRVYIHDKS